MIPFINRFHGHNSLRFVYKNGQVVRSHMMIIKTIANPQRKNSRIAIVIGKKVLKSAVLRNRVRRRIYEHMRNTIPSMNGVYDVVIIVLSGEALTITYPDMSNQINQLLRQTGIIA